MALEVTLNGQTKEFPQLEASARLNDVLDALELKADRVAVEHNGEIAPRANWAETVVRSGDRLEVVHFVGGGQ